MHLSQPFLFDISKKTQRPKNSKLKEKTQGFKRVPYTPIQFKNFAARKIRLCNYCSQTMLEFEHSEKFVQKMSRLSKKIKIS